MMIPSLFRGQAPDNLWCASKEVKKVKQYSKTQNIPVKVFEYENADHGFNCSQRKSYNKMAAEEAFEKTIKFLKD